MRIATLTLVLALLAAAPAAAAVEHANTAATYIGGLGGHPISGDGRRVVFDDYTGTPTDGDFEIYIWEDGTGLTRITDEYPEPGLNKVAGLDIDSDGTAVAAIASGDLADTGAATYELYRWTAEADWQRLSFTSGTVPKLHFVSGLAISEDGTRIAFTSRDDYTGANRDGTLQVFLWDEGTGISQVTDGSPCSAGGGNVLGDLSGDGRRILFTSSCQYGTTNEDLGFDLYLWDESAGVRALTETKPGDTAGRATLNRDGTVAALVSPDDLTDEGVTGYRVYRWVDGRGFELLTEEPTSPATPSISADGGRIAYVAANGQGNPAINPEGTDELFLWQEGAPDLAALTDSDQTDPDSIGNDAPHFSADGIRLSMVARRAFDSPLDLRTGHYVIDILSAAGANAKPSDNPKPTLQGAAGLGGTAVSPIPLRPGQGDGIEILP